MRATEPERDNSFHFHEVALDDVERFSNAIEDMYNGQLDGLVIRRVFEPDTAERLAQRIESGDAPIERLIWPEHVKQSKTLQILGRPLMVEQDQERYLASAARFRDDCRALFAGEPDFEEHLTTVLEAVSGGRPVSVPTTPDGAIFSPASIRMLPPGGEVTLHVGNEFLRYPQARQLAKRADISFQLSFFITLRPADAGGELIVYSLTWDDVEKIRIERDGFSRGYGVTRQVEALLAGSERMSIKPEVGDLLMFNGGQYYHCVTPVQGERVRVTIGGFLVFSPEHDAIHYWS